uniref:PARP-type domain-containing protein n=1 Tax=viral metagenome TaxID=1070528 RepID=A0A6M3LJA8_9ZZZZ
MAIYIEASIASGRGTCRICDKKIERNTVQIVGWGWKNSGRVHYLCIKEQIHELYLNKSEIDISKINSKK